MKTNLKITVAIFVLAISSFTALEAQTKKEINSGEVTELQKKEKTMVILDMRTPDEFNAGHLKGAQNINVREDGWQSKVDKLNPNAKYLVYCRTNHRSGIAVDYMMQKKFKNVYQMMDGFTGWTANSFPVVK